jgi:hypothetical protein
MYLWMNAITTMPVNMYALFKKLVSHLNNDGGGHKSLAGSALHIIK